LAFLKIVKTKRQASKEARKKIKRKEIERNRESCISGVSNIE
jgi:hypothetical protein